MILVANDPQTHVATPRSNGTMRRRVRGPGSVDVGTFGTTNGSEVRGRPPPQSSKEAGLDRVLLLRNSTLTSCSHSIASIIGWHSGIFHLLPLDETVGSIFSHARKIRES
jgi:hypothetical protein